MPDEIEARVRNGDHERFSRQNETRLRSALRMAADAVEKLPDGAQQGLLMGAALAASVATLTLATTAPAMAAQSDSVAVAGR